MNKDASTNTVTNNTVVEPKFTPMEGVKIAPPSDAPVDASSTENMTKANTPSAVLPQGGQPVPKPTVQLPQQPAQQPQILPVGEQPALTPPPQVQPQPEEKKEEVPAQPVPKQKKRINLVPILVVLLVALGFYCFYTTHSLQNALKEAEYEKTPINSSKETKELDINSTLVQSLYSKVATNIREDLAQPEMNNQMKLYLAYRQIPEKEKYESNCHRFSITAMEPYKCEETVSYAPKAFKAETLELKLKEMFGEKHNIPLANIQLRSTCVIGYQYIKERGEFVEGTCNKKTATSFKVTKNLKKATTNRNTIILYEDVNYAANEGLDLPSYLKSGTYLYTFRLDMNYNYVFVNKTFDEKY